MVRKKQKPLFQQLKRGLEEGIAYAQGELTLKTVKIPEDPPTIDAKTIAALRSRAAMSQTIFAKMLNVSSKTLQSWEQGTRKPSDASQRLIQIFSEHPSVLCQSVGLPAITLEGVEIKTGAKGHRKIVVKQKVKKV